MIAGAVLSIRMTTESEDEMPSRFVAEHVRVTPSVSADKDVASQPVRLATADSRSSTAQRIATSVLFQPDAVGVGVIVAWIVGPVVSGVPVALTVIAVVRIDVLPD